MCGRVVQADGVVAFAIRCGIDAPDSREREAGPRFNCAPSQDLWVIRRNPKTGAKSLDRLRFGLLRHWAKDEPGVRMPVNAKSETVATQPFFRDAYRLRRCLVPVDAFFEWRAMKGARNKQPYAVAMKDGSPFALAAIWENWKDAETGLWRRTFAILTTSANDLLAEIHPRMPVILAEDAHERWLGPEPDPADLLRPFDPDKMTLWAISSRVSAARNDDPGLLDTIIPSQA